MHLEKIASVPRQACIGLSGQSVHVGVQRLTLLLPPRYEDMRIHLLGDGATSMVYNPKPIDTSQIRLNAELTDLTERLAENVHDTWARHRLAEGWRYGRFRNDASKEHPNLVPYDQLPEFEREYDRRTALETLRMLLALGLQHRISEARSPSASAHPSAQTTEELERLNDLLSKSPPLEKLVAVWNGRDADAWASSETLFRLTGESVVKDWRALARLTTSSIKV